MAKVNLFPIKTAAYLDTKLAGQLPGNGAAPESFQMPLSAVLALVLDNLPVTTVGSAATVTTATATVSVPAGKWMVGFAVQSTVGQTVTAGTTLGGKNIADAEAVTANTPTTFFQLLYGGTAGATVYFSGLTGTVNLNFLIL